MKKRTKKEEYIKKSNKTLKLSCLLGFILVSIVYLINGGLYSLLFDLRESKAVIIYSILIICFIILLILLNIKDDTENIKEENMTSSYITVGTIALIILFSMLLIFTLIDFFLPIIIFIVIFISLYFILNYVIKLLVNKYDIK